MITVLVELDSKKSIVRFDVSGHAGYDIPGKDIVCAAVSAIVQTAIIGLTDVVALEVEWKQKDGNVRCKIPQTLEPDKMEKANVVLQTMLLGLKSIQTGYESFLSVIEKEAK